MVIETGKPIAEVARDLDIHDGRLGKRHLLLSRAPTRRTDTPSSPSPACGCPKLDSHPLTCCFPAGGRPA
jgi:hypothetical protein